MKEIKLTQGKVALVDDEDFEYLNQFKWFAVKDKCTFYAIRNARKEDGTRTTVKMHRIVMKTPEGMEVDHKDGDGLNCQKYNMRNCTHAQNMINKKIGVIGTSKFKGVCWYPNYKKWRVQITMKNKKISLGYYSSEKEAALIYNGKAVELHGEFARINII